MRKPPMIAVLAAAVAATSCIWHSAPQQPTPCTRLSVPFRPATRFALVNEPQLTFPFTIIVDDYVLGIAQTDSDLVAQQMKAVEPSSVKEVELVPAARASKRWPHVTTNVISITRCHEPTRPAISTR
jgi:hypothetical protein